MKFNIKEDGKRIVVVCLAAFMMALNIKSFVRTGGLYPGVTDTAGCGVIF